MNRLIEKTVFSGLVIAWRFATWPTRRSPLLVKATTDGVVRAPSWFAITVGWPPSMTATTELVVPKSMPMILAIVENPLTFKIYDCGRRGGPTGLVQTHYQTLVSCCQVIISLLFSINKRALGALQERLDQRRMAFQGRCDADVQGGMGILNRCNQFGQVSFQVEAEGQEIRQDDDLPDTPAGENRYGSGQIGLAEFEEGRLDLRERTQFGQIAGNEANPFIGGF